MIVVTSLRNNHNNKKQQRATLLLLQGIYIIIIIISSVFLLLVLFPIPVNGAAAAAAAGSVILVVGATGGTGLRAIRGLLDTTTTTTTTTTGHLAPKDFCILTRNREKPVAKDLASWGFPILQADLDSSAETLSQALLLWRRWSTSTTSENDDDDKIFTGCYVHSTAADTKVLDTGEAKRAKTLADALVLYNNHIKKKKNKKKNKTNKKRNGIQTVVFNSAVGEPGHGVYRIQQKHDAEDAYIGTFAAAAANDNSDIIQFVSLRANLFMEELWKDISGRPKILSQEGGGGKFTFAVPPNRKLYLTSVRDMGRLAGRFLLRSDDDDDDNNHDHDNQASTTSTLQGGAGQQQQQQQRHHHHHHHHHHHPNNVIIMNVAGDCLTCPEIAAAFAHAQGSPCRHRRGRILELVARLFFRDLYSIIRYYQVGTDTTDIHALCQQFPGDSITTSFAQFLEETQWGDRNKCFDDFMNVTQTLQ